MGPPYVLQKVAEANEYCNERMISLIVCGEPKMDLLHRASAKFTKGLAAW